MDERAVRSQRNRRSPGISRRVAKVCAWGVKRELVVTVTKKM